MGKKIEIPEEGKICTKLTIELSSECLELSLQLSRLSDQIDTLIPESAETTLMRLRDLFLKRYLGVFSVHLRKASADIKSYVFGELADEMWVKLGRDSERLGYFAHNILNAIEVVSVDETKQPLIEGYRKTLLITNGVLKTVSAGIRLNKFSKSGGLS